MREFEVRHRELCRIKISKKKKISRSLSSTAPTTRKKEVGNKAEQVATTNLRMGRNTGSSEMEKIRRNIRGRQQAIKKIKTENQSVTIIKDLQKRSND